VHGGSAWHWTGEDIPEGLERPLWEIAKSDTDYAVRQHAARALRNYQKPRPWRAILENRQMYRNLLNNVLIGLFFVPALVIFVGFFVARRWLLLLWIVLSLWLLVMYAGTLIAGLGHARPSAFLEAFLVVAITAGVQALLLVFAFRQRRARLGELSYDAPTAPAVRRN
jgi:hypothetical protein